MAGPKRKAKADSLPNKRKRTLPIDELPWQSISLGTEVQDGSAILGFEEVDGIVVEYGEVGNNGLRTAKFVVEENGQPSKGNDTSEEAEEWVPAAEESDSEADTAVFIKKQSPPIPKSKQSILAFDNHPFECRFIIVNHA